VTETDRLVPVDKQLGSDTPRGTLNEVLIDLRSDRRTAKKCGNRGSSLDEVFIVTTNLLQGPENRGNVRGGGAGNVDQRVYRKILKKELPKEKISIPSKKDPLPGCQTPW